MRESQRFSLRQIACRKQDDTTTDIVHYSQKIRRKSEKQTDGTGWMSLPGLFSSFPPIHAHTAPLEREQPKHTQTLADILFDWNTLKTHERTCRTPSGNGPVSGLSIVRSQAKH